MVEFNEVDSANKILRFRRWTVLFDEAVQEENIRSAETKDSFHVCNFNKVTGNAQGASAGSHMKTV